MVSTSWKEALSSTQLHRILEVLDACGEADTSRTFSAVLVDAMSSIFGVRDVTFFRGRDFEDIFADPAPTLTGATENLLVEYHERWRDKDIFALPEVRGMLSRTGFVTLEQLTSLPKPQRSYVEDYLHPHGMGTASALHLRFADGEALVGLFDRETRWDASDTLSVSVLARHLRAQSRSISISSEDPVRTSRLDALTPRQREVADLVSRGLSNLEIAQVLTLSELTVKKYVSRIFDTTGYRNRSSLTAAVLHHRASVRSRERGVRDHREAVG